MTPNSKALALVSLCIALTVPALANSAAAASGAGSGFTQNNEATNITTDIGNYVVFALSGDLLWHGAASMPDNALIGANSGSVHILDSTSAQQPGFAVAASHVEVQGLSQISRVVSDTLVLGEQAAVLEHSQLERAVLLEPEKLPVIEAIACGGANITVTSGNSPYRLEPGRYDTITVTMNQRLELVEGGRYELCRMNLNRGSSILVHADNTIALRDFLSSEARVRMEGDGACAARWIATGVIDSGAPNSAAFDFGDGNGANNRALIAGQFLTNGRIAMEQHNDYVGRFWGGDILAGPESVVSRTVAKCSAPQCGDGDLDPGEACDDGNNAEGDCCSALCSLAAPSSPCDDGLFCTADDRCDDQGSCLGTGSPCTGNDGDADCAESCNEELGACNGPDPFGSPCDDGLFCNGLDRCEAGQCVGSGNSPCAGPDGDADCAESCDEASRSCTGPDPLGSVCDDSAFCTTNDRCREGGICAGDPEGVCPGADGDGDCSESCNEATQDCTAPDPFGVGCNDDLFCTLTDTCNAAGECRGQGDPCSGPDGDVDCSESCNESEQACTAPDPEGAGCDDGVSCSVGDQCSLGVCLSGEERGCNDANPCTDDFCDANGGCTSVFNEAPCDDGNACTLLDRCERGVCVGTTPVDCEDGDLCTVDSCDPRDGSCTSALIPATTCNEDGDGRTRFEIPFTPAARNGTASLTALWRGVRNGQPTERSQFADPTSGESWALCVFDTLDGKPELRYRLDLDASDVNERAWKRRETQNKLVYKLRDPLGNAGGASKARMILDRHNRAILKLAAGANVGCKPPCRDKFQSPEPVNDDQLFSMEPDTVVQWSSSAGACWSSRFLEAKENTAASFNARLRRHD